MPKTRSSRRSSVKQVLKSKDNIELDQDETTIDTSSPSDMKKGTDSNKGEGKENKLKKKRSISDRSPALEKSRKKTSSETINEPSEALSTPTKDENGDDKENNSAKVGVTPYWKVCSEQTF